MLWVWSLFLRAFCCALRHTLRSQQTRLRAQPPAPPLLLLHPAARSWLRRRASDPRERPALRIPCRAGSHSAAPLAVESAAPRLRAPTSRGDSLSRGPWGVWAIQDENSKRRVNSSKVNGHLMLTGRFCRGAILVTRGDSDGGAILKGGDSATRGAILKGGVSVERGDSADRGDSVEGRFWSRGAVPTEG